jgi:hypothetical protein
MNRQKARPLTPYLIFYLTLTMSTSPTLRLDYDNSLGPVHPTAERREPSFDYASISDEQIQQIFDGHTYVTNSTQMSDESKVDGSEAKVDGNAALVVPDEQPFGLSPPTIHRPSSPIGVENLGVPPVEPVVAENDADEVAPPKKKRKVARQWISYSKRKLLAGSENLELFFLSCDSQFATVLRKIVCDSQQCWAKLYVRRLLMMSCVAMMSRLMIMSRLLMADDPWWWWKKNGTFC